jgi:hypothetical protein
VPVLACFVLLLLGCPPVLIAQSISVSSGSEVTFTTNAALNLPYTATYEATTVQTLSDGTKITTTYKTKEARDSQGRWYHEVTNQTPDGNEMTHVFVNDPVEHVLLNWSTSPNGPNKAFVTHMPDPGEGRKAVNHPVPQQPVRSTVHLEASKESLGSKTILGVVAEGVRHTRTIPAGAQGNDRPMTMVTEVWRSPDLNIILSTTSDDPREGHRSNEITSLDRGEPSPTLFQPPAGYEVEDRQMHPQ